MSNKGQVLAQCKEDYFQLSELTTMEWTSNEFPVTAGVQAEAGRFLPLFGTR